MTTRSAIRRLVEIASQSRAGSDEKAPPGKAVAKKKVVQPTPNDTKVVVDVEDDHEYDVGAKLMSKSVAEATNQRVAVVAFGRLNPPTTGHEKLVQQLAAIAKHHGARATLFLSHTQDTKSNPLSHADKVRIATKAFGRFVDVSRDASIRTLFDIPKMFDGKADKLVVVAGSDRVPEFKQKLNAYNGKEYSFDSIEVVSAGDRDPDADGAVGMSASKARSFAAAGDAASFKEALPSAVRSNSQAIMASVRRGMGLSGLTEAFVSQVDEVLSMQARMKKRLAMVRLRVVMRAARARALRKRANNATLMRRATKRARNLIRQRILKTVNYQDLPLAARGRVDKMVAKRRKVIARIAMRMLPKLKRAEMSRDLGTVARIPAAGATRPTSEQMMRVVGSLLSESSSPPIAALLVPSSSISLYEAWCLTRGSRLDPQTRHSIQEGIVASIVEPGRRSGEWIVESKKLGRRLTVPEDLIEPAALIAASSHLRISLDR